MAIAMSSASNGETASDLLDQLITQGLAPNNQDLYKIRQLIIILFQACILQPLSEVFTPESLRRARDTLRILHHHASSRPELLSLPSPQPADNIPLFKVLLPRIIYASVKYAGREAAERLPEELLEAGSGILRAMCRQMQENGSGCVKGRYAAIMAAKALQAFSHGEPYQGVRSFSSGSGVNSHNPVWFHGTHSRLQYRYCCLPNSFIIENVFR